MAASSNTSQLLDGCDPTLPLGIWSKIWSLLPLQDLKNVRLTSHPWSDGAAAQFYAKAWAKLNLDKDFEDHQTSEEVLAYLKNYGAGRANNHTNFEIAIRTQLPAKKVMDAVANVLFAKNGATFKHLRLHYEPSRWGPLLPKQKERALLSFYQKLLDHSGPVLEGLDLEFRFPAPVDMTNCPLLEAAPTPILPVLKKLEVYIEAEDEDGNDVPDHGLFPRILRHAPNLRSLSVWASHTLALALKLREDEPSSVLEQLEEIHCWDQDWNEYKGGPGTHEYLLRAPLNLKKISLTLSQSLVDDLIKVLDKFKATLEWINLTIWLEQAKPAMAFLPFPTMPKLKGMKIVCTGGGDYVSFRMGVPIDVLGLSHVFQTPTQLKESLPLLHSFRLDIRSGVLYEEASGVCVFEHFFPQLDDVTFSQIHRMELNSFESRFNEPTYHPGFKEWGLKMGVAFPNVYNPVLNAFREGKVPEGWTIC